MPRAKTRVASRNRRKKVLKQASGYFGKRGTSIRSATDAVLRAGQFAYRDRRRKKRDFRSLWIVRINAAARECGTTYGRLISGLSKKGITLDRKTLAHLALHEPETFKALAAQVTNGASVTEVKKAEPKPKTEKKEETTAPAGEEDRDAPEDQAGNEEAEKKVEE